MAIDQNVLSQLKLWTRAEYDRLIEAGALEGQHVELIEGVLVEMSPQGPLHYEVVRRLITMFGPLLQAGFSFGVQGPLAVGPTSEPEPDFVVIKDENYAKGLPDTAFLVVEVAVSSRAVDLQAKPRLYSAAGVPEYWVVDVGAREVVVHRGPHWDGYAEVRRVGPGETLHPTALPRLIGGIDVAALLP